jgi:ABC-2 type transport system permease protein
MARFVDALPAAFGVDATQWRALARTYIRMDFRSAGGAVRQHGRQRAGASPLAGLMIVTGIGGIAFALIAAAMSDLQMSATLLTTYGAANVMMLLLVDFTGVVVSPNDYGVLGHRPVSSRTYFAARLASIVVYVSAISFAVAAFPSAVFLVKAGPLALPATFAAVLLCNLSTTVLVITAYVLLLRWIHPSRLRRAMGYVQLLAASSFYLAYYLGTRAMRDAFFSSLTFDSVRWLWLFPSAWYAAFVPLAAGRASSAAVAATLAALAVTVACVPLAAGRLSLDYSQRIGEMTAAGEPVRRGRRRSLVLPGFASAERRAVSLLVRAQFRYDQRFRMAILGILPLTGFYLLLGLDQGALQDPFTTTRHLGGPGIYMALVFIPLTLHAALTVSESWRAAWIFFASPASHARIVIAAKNFVAVYFLGSYLVVLAGFWSVFFDRVWHAIVHAVFVGMIAHFLLQLVVILKPALPFAAEPRKAERSSGMFVAILVGSVVASVAPLFLPFVYQRPVVAAGVLVFALAVTAAIELALRMRVNEAIGDLEFRG